MALDIAAGWALVIILARRSLFLDSLPLEFLFVIGSLALMITLLRLGLLVTSDTLINHSLFVRFLVGKLLHFNYVLHSLGNQELNRVVNVVALGHRVHPKDLDSGFLQNL